MGSAKTSHVVNGKQQKKGFAESGSSDVNPMQKKSQGNSNKKGLSFCENSEVKTKPNISETLLLEKLFSRQNAQKAASPQVKVLEEVLEYFGRWWS